MEQKELLNTQTNAPNTPKEPSSEIEQLIEREQISGSPFWIIGDQEKGYFLTFGKWQLTEPYQTKLDVLNSLKENEYDIILKMILCIIDPKNEINSLNKTLKP